jgi:hypothetical protein
MNKVNGNVVNVVSNYDTYGYGQVSEYVEILAEVIGQYAAQKLPFLQSDSNKIVVGLEENSDGGLESFKLTFYDASVKYFAKKGTRFLISRFVPQEIVMKIGGLKYIGDGLVNIIVGVLTKKLLDLIGMGLLGFDTWSQEFIDETKTEVLKQVTLAGFDMIAKNINI